MKTNFGLFESGRFAVYNLEVIWAIAVGQAVAIGRNLYSNWTWD